MDDLTLHLILIGLGIAAGWAVTAIWYEWFVLDKAWGNHPRKRGKQR